MWWGGGVQCRGAVLWLMVMVMVVVVWLLSLTGLHWCVWGEKERVCVSVCTVSLCCVVVVVGCDGDGGVVAVADGVTLVCVWGERGERESVRV